MTKYAHEHSAGQVLLIVLLAMAATLVVTLSVVSRSVSDISETASEDESSRAFSAAEAGIEKALIVGTNIADTNLSNRSSFSATVSDVAQGGTTYNYPGELASADSATVWFVSHDVATGSLICSPPGTPCYRGTTLEVCWGDPAKNAGAATPAMEFSYVYDGGGNPKGVVDGDWSGVRVGRAAIDPLPGRPNNFTQLISGGTDCNIGGVDYKFSKTFDLSALCSGCNLSVDGTSLMAKIRLLYNTPPNGVADIFGVRATSGATLPGQGKKIEATGKSGDAIRKVQVYQTFGELPPIFDAVLFSPININKVSNN